MCCQSIAAEDLPRWSCPISVDSTRSSSSVNCPLTSLWTTSTLLPVLNCTTCPAPASLQNQAGQALVRARNGFKESEELNNKHRLTWMAGTLVLPRFPYIQLLCYHSVMRNKEIVMSGTRNMRLRPLVIIRNDLATMKWLNMSAVCKPCSSPWHYKGISLECSTNVPTLNELMIQSKHSLSDPLCINHRDSTHKRHCTLPKDTLSNLIQT